MKKSILILLGYIFSLNAMAQSQFGINTDTPKASSVLEINSTDKGLLIPRLSTTQRTSIASPDTGLIVYDSTVQKFWYYDGVWWEALAKEGYVDALGWTTSGNTISTLNNVNIGGDIDVAGSIAPAADNLDSLGSSDKRWKVVYAANGTIQTSDRRSKKNILPSPYGLAEIIQMKPVTYYWKEAAQSNAKRKIGLIAQEVQTLVPEVVTSGRLPHELLGMNYTELVPVLIKAIQEQQEQIDLLGSENAALRETIKSQSDDIATIKTTLLNLTGDTAGH